MSRRGSATPLSWLGGLLTLYLAVPLVAFVVRFASSHNRGFSTPGLFGALYISVATATISAGLVAIVGIPLAYLLARSHGRVAAVIGVIVQLPLALPPLMGGILLVNVVGPYTALGEFFARHLTDSMIGVVLAQSFVSAPFLIVTARSAFAAVDRNLPEHASTLGHLELSRFWRVNLPIAGPGIRAGLLLTWLRAFGEYGATVVLAYHPYTLPVYTYVQFSSSGIPTTQAPTALALIVAATVATVWRLPGPRRRTAEIPASPAAPRMQNPTPVECDLDLVLGSFRLAVAYDAATARLGILGPSGSGKSLTLRAIAGLLGPSVGRVAFGGEVISHLPVESRGIGYVPQGHGLFPHLTVWDQVCFGVGADPALAAHWLERLHLRGLEDRFPAELSGGQRQRVALAQALALSPRLLLLDEPFSALDAPVRDDLRTEMRSLQRESELSTVLVTHDPEEAAYLSDELVVLSQGRVLQAGPREEVFAHPASPEVARLLGYRNMCRGVVSSVGEVTIGSSKVAMPTSRLPPGTGVLWSIRPEEVHIQESGTYEAVLVDSADLGAYALTVIEIGGVRLEARGGSRVTSRPGTPVRVDLPRVAIRVWPVSTAETSDATSHESLHQ